MKLILVTTPTYFIEEDKILTALFEEGLDSLHLRKPDTAPMFAERLLTLIPVQYHKRIVVHGHFYLKEEFGLKGIHINNRNPLIPENYKGHISCTAHSLCDIKEKRQSNDYVILDPIYKEEYSNSSQTSTFTNEELTSAYKAGLIDKKIMASGGINESNIAQIKELGFGGVVVMNGLWESFNTCCDRDYSILIEQFRKLKKLCD